MPEATLTTSVISLDNWFLEAELYYFYSNTYGSSLLNNNESLGYPLSNLTDPRRSMRWRSKSGSTDAYTIRYDLGQDRDPGVFGIIDANFLNESGFYAIVLSGSNTPFFDTGAGNGIVTWNSTFYNRLESNKINQFNLGTPTSNELSYTSRRYWQFIMLGTTLYGIDDNADYMEVGNFWLGERTTIDIRPNISFNTRAFSDVGTSDFGNFNFTQYTTANELRFETAPMDIEDALNLKKSVQEYARLSKPVLLDIYPHLSDTTRRTHGHYYGKISKFDLQHVTADYAKGVFVMSESLG